MLVVSPLSLSLVSRDQQQKSDKAHVTCLRGIGSDMDERGKTTREGGGYSALPFAVKEGDTTFT